MQIPGCSHSSDLERALSQESSQCEWCCQGSAEAHGGCDLQGQATEKTQCGLPHAHKMPGHVEGCFGFGGMAFGYI